MAEQWTLKGRIVVDHLLPELAEAFGTREGIPGVTVKVSARSKIPTGWGWWNSWGKVVTGADGSFRVSESHGSDRRQFKVEVLFDSDRLRLKEGQETSIRLDGNGFPLDVEFDLTDKDWFEVHNDDRDGAANGRQAGVTNIGDIAVTGAVAHRLADMWCLYNRAMDLLEGYGAAYAFAGRVVVKYPMGLAGNNPASVILQQSADPQPLHQGGPVDDPNPTARVHAPVGLRPLDRRGRHGMAAPEARHHPRGPREHDLRALPRGVRRLGRAPGAEGAYRRQAAQLQGGCRLEVPRDSAQLAAMSAPPSPRASASSPMSTSPNAAGTACSTSSRSPTSTVAISIGR